MAKGAGQNTSHAVMAQRAPDQVDTDTPEQRLFRQLDFYPTPPWAVRAGAALLQKIDPDALHIWEPACGAGHMTEPLTEFFARVVASDIHDFGLAGAHQHNFLDGTLPGFVTDELGGDNPDWIVTNPPFLKAEQFVRCALPLVERGVAVLCRLSFLESAARYPLFFGPSPTLLSYVAYFVERVPMVVGRYDPKASTATAYAWFIFDKDYCNPEPSLLAIAPGSRRRFTRPDDVRRFAQNTPTPLFEGAHT